MRLRTTQALTTVAVALALVVPDPAPAAQVCGCKRTTNGRVRRITAGNPLVCPTSQVLVCWNEDPPPGDISARVSRSTDFVVPDNTNHAVAFDTEEFDTDGMFDVGQPTRLTINTAGKYLITGYVEFDNPTGAGAFHELTIRVNGSNRIARELNVPIAGEQPTTTSMYYSLNAGDYVELIVRQVSGSSQNYDVPEAPALMVVKVP